MLLLFIYGMQQDLRDEVLKVTYLPYPEARPLIDVVAERLRSIPASEAKRVAKMFLPAIQKVPAVPVRLDRKIAALRAVEALRLHAAGNGGQLPERLDQVTVVPIPRSSSSRSWMSHVAVCRASTMSSLVTKSPVAAA